MLHFDDHVAGARLRIGKRLEHVIDRSARNPPLLEHVEPMRSRLDPKARRKLCLELVQVCHPIGAADETRIACKLERIERFQRPQPILLVRPADDDPAVARLERLVWRIERMRGAHGARRHTGCERNGGLPIGLYQGGFEQ